MSAFEYSGMSTDPHMIIDHDIFCVIDSLSSFSIDNRVRVRASNLEIPRKHTISTNGNRRSLATNKVTTTYRSMVSNFQRIVIDQLHDD
ncbi:hypothetical protein CBM2623_B80050 [Cupriavidus taiwanensis]|nr:hypothetical protein CBM2608_B90053 [Cupriavidus taiwanensis]SPA36422.1 hypothetical protein CBM2623_B80050 [Cupriavidus taiwanensis]